jgi:hypothetical protein
MTLRSTAIYHAKAAFSLMTLRGLGSALVRFETDHGVRYRFEYEDADGARFVVILRRASDYREHGGAVDASMTKAANVKAVQEPAQEPAQERPAIVGAVAASALAAFMADADRLADAIDDSGDWWRADLHEESPACFGFA